jgi:hypothetical protein
MSVYIVPFDQNNNRQHLDTSGGLQLCEIYYKTAAGPLGFNMDEASSIIFRKVVAETIWYCEYRNDFEMMDPAFLSKSRIYRFNGVFMIPTEHIKKEIEVEHQRRVIVTKNKLRERYGKPLLPEIPGFFTNIYDKTARRYAPEKINALLRDTPIVIGDSDSLGGHFIVEHSSVFMDRLLHACNELNVPVHKVDSDLYVPAW